MTRPGPDETKLVLCVQFRFSFWSIPPELPEAIRQRYPQMRVVHLTSYDLIPAEIPDTDIFAGFTLTPDQLTAARKLKWFHVTAAGVAQLMRPDVLASGITVTNSRGIHAIPMAEHTMGMILSLARKFPASVRYQQQHRWAQQEIWDARPNELRGKILLIVGYGTIGRELARLGVSVDLAPVADGHHQDHKPVVLDRCNDAAIADAVAPEPLAVARQRVAETARILAAGDAFAQVAQHAPLGVHPKLAQVAHGGAIEFDPPGRRSHQRLVRLSRARSRLSSVTRDPPRARRRRAR